MRSVSKDFDYVFSAVFLEYFLWLAWYANGSLGYSGPCFGNFSGFVWYMTSVRCKTQLHSLIWLVQTFDNIYKNGCNSTNAQVDKSKSDSGMGWWLQIGSAWWENDDVDLLAPKSRKSHLIALTNYWIHTHSDSSGRQTITPTTGSECCSFTCVWGRLMLPMICNRSELRRWV